MKYKSVHRPKILGMLCNWSGYKAADLCGALSLEYPPYVRLIRVMCSDRVDIRHIFSAFSNGADGVFVGACPFGSCHYWTQGNYAAASMVQLCKKILEYMGVYSERLCIEWMNAGDGLGFALRMRRMGTNIERLGPIGQAEGIDELRLITGLDRVIEIIPDIQRAHRKKLENIHGHDQIDYTGLYTQEEIDYLLRDVLY